MFRDIKVDNILVDDSLCAFLGDWGIACHLPSCLFVEGLHGTPGYVPFEAVVGRRYRADYQDVFAMG